ncbi:MAG: glycoside hydrolase family 95 protein [Verrucomicrobia bacterium]|nr:MAG: glycoside hydrolase family 95 protein [Verrucomicrobiota bacterium]
MKTVLLTLCCLLLAPLAALHGADAPKPEIPATTLFEGEASPPGSSLALWYRRPAARWLEALPIGNGRLGAMVFGGVAGERLALNESTFWSGAPSAEHENPGAAAAFDRIRELFRAGKHAEAGPLVRTMLGRELNYGTSLPAGDLLLAQSGIDGAIADYRRELDLDEAVARVGFAAHGVRFLREVWASHPDGVVVMRCTADRPGSIGFTLGYDGGKVPWESAVRGDDTLVVSARALEKKHSDGKCGTALGAVIRVVTEGGTVTAEGRMLRVKGADAATVLVALNTDLRGGDPAAASERQIAAALRKTPARLRAAHVADHRRLFRRVALDLGGGEASRRPTDTRLAASRGGQADPQLAALFFQYGRYLTIAGSREDSPLPLHLQGIWNDGLAAGMGWTCDYHLDINTEQNYWASEVGNLGECGAPLFRLVEGLQVPGRRTARTVYGIDRGWVCHVFTNPWGFTAPGWWTGWGLHVTGGVWISGHLWEHYLYTGDRDFLKRSAYPVLKGAAEFFLEYLYPDPVTGHLSTGPSVSPERGGETGPGPVHDRALVHELFGQCIEASRTLGVDADFRARLEAARANLPPYKIGANGQLQEWFHTDDGGKTEHRHTSHLVGLFPLAQITPRGTPDLARAAAKSLELRMQHPGWEDVEWSAGNAVCYQARLGDGETAHRALLNLLNADTDTDLLTFSRGGIAGASQNIFCIDGNTSGAAGIAEMLLQSHAGEIELLPALPKAWPTGSVRGLRARGGFTVAFDWKDGRVTRYQIHSARPADAKIRVNGEVKSIRSRALRAESTR